MMSACAASARVPPVGQRQRQDGVEQPVEKIGECRARRARAAGRGKQLVVLAAGIGAQMDPRRVRLGP